MDRRDFLKSTACAAAVVATGAAAGAGHAFGAAAPVATPSVVRAVRCLHLSAPWRLQTAGHADDAFRLAREIEAASAGAIKIEISEAGDGAGTGSLIYQPVAARVGEHPGFAYFAGLPGAAGLEPHHLQTWLSVHGAQTHWDLLSAMAGVKPLLAGHSGPLPVLWSTAPLTAPEDFHGRRIFARGLAADVVRGLGGDAVAVPENAMERVLQAAEVDGVEWGGLVASSSLGLPGQMRHGLAGGLTRSGAAFALEVPLDLWFGLTAAEREVISTAAQAAYLRSLDEDRASRSATEQAIAARFGVRIAPPPRLVSEAVDRVATAIVAHMAGFDRHTAAIDRSYGRFLKSAGRARGGALTS